MIESTIVWFKDHFDQKLIESECLWTGFSLNFVASWKLSIKRNVVNHTNLLRKGTRELKISEAKDGITRNIIVAIVQHKCEDASGKMW